MPQFICQEAQHNKFWNYTINNLTVNIEYGRVGGTKQTDVKSFGDQYSLNAFVQKKVREKEGKGYKEVSEEKLIKESNIAQNIGTQNKICEMNFVKYDGNNNMEEINSYDEKESIVVKMMNSWNKEEFFYLINKNECFKLSNVRKNHTSFGFTSKYKATYDVKNGLLQAIEDIAGKIQQAIVNLKDLSRAINLEPDVNKKKIKMMEFTRTINLETGISEQVAEKMFSVGNRKINLDFTNESSVATKTMKRKIVI